MDFKEYFKKNKVKLTKAERRAIKIIGMLTNLQLFHSIPQEAISLIEKELLSLLKDKVTPPSTKTEI